MTFYRKLSEEVARVMNVNERGTKLGNRADFVIFDRPSETDALCV